MLVFYNLFLCSFACSVGPILGAIESSHKCMSTLRNNKQPMNTIIEKRENLDYHHLVPENPNAKSPSERGPTSLLSMSNLNPTFFFLSLFVEYSRAYHVPMSIPVNHRTVEISEILRKRNGLNLVDALGEESGTQIHDSRLVIIFYEITGEPSKPPQPPPQPRKTNTRQSKAAAKEVDDAANDSEIVDMEDDEDDTQSTESTTQNSKLTYPISSLLCGIFLVGDKTKYVRIQFPDVKYASPSRDTFALTMQLFHILPNDFDYTIAGNTYNYFDWGPLLNYKYMPTGHSIENLKAFLKECSIPTRSGMTLQMKTFLLSDVILDALYNL